MTQITTWPGWECVRQIGAGSFGKVYEIKKEENGKVYKSALKVISIPQNAQDLENILDESMDEKAATQYFKSFVDAVTNEFVLMSSLKGEKNIVSYEDHMVIEREGEIGWDILIKMELLTPLMKWCVEHPLSENDVVRLGCDMSHALELCHGKKIIHRDIKPQNIFVDKDGNFKLGDFGIARVVERTNTVMSQKGTYTYMAPEVFKGQKYNVTADIYSLGIVLYRFLNQNRTPFLPLGNLNYTDHQAAQDRRMSGEVVPPPISGSERLKEIVLKTLEYEAVNRVQNAAELRELLEKCMDCKSIGENAIQNETEIFGDDDLTQIPKFEKSIQKELIDEKIVEEIEEELDVTRLNITTETEKMPKKKKLWIIVAVLGGIILILAFYYANNLNNNSSNDVEYNSSYDSSNDVEYNSSHDSSNDVEYNSSYDSSNDTEYDSLYESVDEGIYEIMNTCVLEQYQNEYLYFYNSETGEILSIQESGELIVAIDITDYEIADCRCDEDGCWWITGVDTGIATMIIYLSNGDKIETDIYVY